MSRLAKKPIEIPENVEIKIGGAEISVKGPKGNLSRFFDDVVHMEKTEKGVELKAKKLDKQAPALLGTYTSHIKNMIEGVTNGFSKKLIIEGVGFRAEARERELILNLGFSHPVQVEIPQGIEIKVEKNIIEVSGIDKELVGQTAAKIRSFKKPEPYKGKGIRYENEVVRRKAGKKAVGVM